MKNLKDEKVMMNRDEYVDMLSRQKNEINMTNNNKKTGLGCLTINMPVMASCRDDAPCHPSQCGSKMACYACKGRQAMARIEAAYYRNFRLYNEDADGFFEQMRCKIRFTGIKMVRYFDAGDIPSADFFNRMVGLANKMPDVRFLCYTKKYSIINEHIDNGGEMPNNLKIYFSAWDKSWDVENKHGLPMAFIRFKDEEKNRNDIKGKTCRCDIPCSACGYCFNPKTSDVIFDEH